MKLSSMAKYLMVTLAASGLTIVSFWAIAGDSTSAGGPPPSGQTTSGGQTTTSGGQTTTSGEQPPPKRAGTAKPSTDSSSMKRNLNTISYGAITSTTKVQTYTVPGWVPHGGANAFTPCPPGEQTDTVYANVRVTKSKIPYYSKVVATCKQTYGGICGLCCDNYPSWQPSFKPNQSSTGVWYGDVEGGGANGGLCGGPPYCGATNTLDPTTPYWDYVVYDPSSSTRIAITQICYVISWGRTRH